MKTFYWLLIAVTLWGGTSVTLAQDYHLSQYDMAPLYLNPALTGRFMGEDNKFRLCGNYRTQWQKLQSKPYSTVAISYDMPYKRFGFGGFIMDNLAGAGNFSTLNVVVSGAYQITENESKFHYLTAGLQLGLLQKSMNRNELLFESQYSSTGGLDPDITSGEFFTKENLMRFDANLGMFYKYRDMNKKFRPFAGFAVYHATMPDESFTGLKSRMPMRLTLHGGCDIQAGKQVLLSPNLLFMHQRKAQEINVGMMGYYDIKETPYNLMLGFNYRIKDAVVVQAGIKQGNSIFRISYDIITNYLKNFGGRRGGFEMGIVYTGISKS